jgi:DNA-binding NarL/FixJ family response regulator
LLSGATDNAASHRLNMSARTFSRRVAELLDVLGVQTRFQAGFEIARRVRQRAALPAESSNRERGEW